MACIKMFPAIFFIVSQKQTMGLSQHRNQNKKRRGIHTAGFVLLILFFLGTSYLHAETNDDIISDSETEQINKRNEKETLQAEIETFEKQYQAIQNLYAKGYERYLRLKSLAAEHSDLHDYVSGKRSNFHPFYTGFFEAFDNYINAEIAEPSNRAEMADEYKKMFVEINGPFVEIPDVNADNIYDDYRSIQVQEWNRRLAGKIAVRMLDAATSMKSRIHAFTAGGRKTDSVISSTNESIDAAIQASVNEGVSFSSAVVTALKESGTGSSTKYDETLSEAESAEATLGYFQDSLNQMIQQEKKLSWIKGSSETALDNTGEFQESLFFLDSATTDAADDVQDKLKPFKDKLTEIKTNIETKKSAVRACDKRIEELDAVISKAELEIAKETYQNSVNDHPFVGGCYTTDISLSVKNGGVVVGGNYMFATDDLTQALTGYPRYLDLQASMGVTGMVEKSTICTDDKGNESIIRYHALESGATGGVDPSLFSFKSSNGALSLDETTMRVTANSATVKDQASTFYCSDEDGYGGYSDDFYICNDIITYTVGSIDAATVKSPELSFKSHTVTKAFLVTDRFRYGLFDAVEKYPETIMFFDKDAPIPDSGYYIAYQLEDSDEWFFKIPDHIEVTFQDLESQPVADLMHVAAPLERFKKSGYAEVEASMDSRNGEKISVASATIVYQVLKPVVNFTDYWGEKVSTSSGTLPYDTSLEFELKLSDYHDETDILQVEWDFAGTVTNGGFSQTIKITDPELIGKTFPVSYKIYYKNSTGNKVVVKTGNYETFNVGAQIEKITAKLNDSAIDILGFQNRFFWEGYWSAGDWVSLFGEREDYQFPLGSFSTDAAQIVYEQRYMAQGINKFKPVENIGSTYTFTPETDMVNSGGSIGLYQRRIITQDDIKTVYNGACLDATPMRYNRRMIVGFNFNLLKLRIQEQDFSRTIAVHVNGPANMEGYSTLWTFADNGTSTAPFVKVDGIFKSSIPHLPDLQTVDVLDSNGKVVSSVNYADYWEKNPIYDRDLRNLYATNLRQSVTTLHIYENGSYRTYTKHAQSGGDSQELMTFGVTLTPGTTNPRVVRINNWYPTQIENIDADQEQVSFFLGNNLLREFEVTTPPQHGVVTNGYHQVSYTPESGFSGIDRFFIQLGGEYAPPASQSSDDYTIDSCILEVVIDMEGEHPMITLTETATGGEIYRASSMYKTFILQFDDTLTISQQTSAADMQLSETDKANDTLTYSDYISQLTETDQGELNEDIQLDFTSHRAGYTKTKTKVLVSEQEIFISRDFLLSRFEELNMKPVKSFNVSILPYQTYNQSTGEHLDYVTLYHDGVEVQQDDVFLLDTFKGFNGIAHKTLSNIDGSPTGLYMHAVFEDENENDDTHKIWFYTSGISPDAPIFFVEKKYRQIESRKGIFTYTPNRSGKVYYVITRDTHKSNQDIRDVAEGSLHSTGVIARGYAGVSASPQELSRELPDDGQDYYLYLFVEDKSGNETPFYRRKMEEIIAGDINADGEVNLTDTIWGLRLLSGHETESTPSGDSNDDGIIGLEDVIFNLMNAD